MEAGVFGPGVLETVLNGGHYYRSLAGNLFLDDLITYFQWCAFWSVNKKESYPCIPQLEELKEKLSKNAACADEFNNAIEASQPLYEDFYRFKKEAEEKSEVCEYLSILQHNTSLQKNLLSSEREGKWDLHVATIDDSMPVLREFDCLHYLRNGGYYNESIKALEFTDPWLFRKYQMGHWVIQENPGKFKAVGGDMKMEQGLQCVSKGPGGHYVVGVSGNAAAVAEFELLFHEVGKIASLIAELTGNDALQHLESNVQPCYSETRRNIFNENLISLLDFMMARKNPYSINAPISSPEPLHNLVTGQKVDPLVAQRILNCLKAGKKYWLEHRQQVFIDKARKPKDKLTRRNLPSLNAKSEQKSQVLQTKNNLTPKSIALAQHDIEIVKERGMSLPEVLEHDVLKCSPLFEGDFPAEAHKSELMKELPQTELVFNRDSPEPTAVLVDFMSKVRRLPLREFQNMGEVVNAVYLSSLNVCRAVESLHMIYDSYDDENSLKTLERQRRSKGEDGVPIHNMSAQTRTPKQPDAFWQCINNKVQTQQISKELVSQRNQVTSSVIVNGELVPAMIGITEIPELNNLIEEADGKLPVHVEYAIRTQKFRRVIVLSNDTDSVMYLLRHTPYFMSCGCIELWVQYGTGDNQRMKPLHELSLKLGPERSKVLVKVHILTGDDIMSKIGTKHAAYIMDPIKYLKSIGETPFPSPAEMAKAEEFLVRVYAGARATPVARTFDGLRLEKYASGKVGINELPPTSHVIHAHIRRGVFLIYKVCNSLNPDAQELDPMAYCFEKLFGVLVPMKSLNPLPEKMTKTCTCSGKCGDKRCTCVSLGNKCVLFCHKNSAGGLCRNRII